MSAHSENYQGGPQIQNLEQYEEGQRSFQWGKIIRPEDVSTTVQSLIPYPYHFPVQRQVRALIAIFGASAEFLRSSNWYPPPALPTTV